jgi:hypothetical protein
MSTMGIPLGRRSVWIATLAALFCAAGVRAPGRAVSPSVSLPSRMTFDATALAAALPSVLTPPVVEPGWRLVSMIAEDIDADGELDVIASDESLGLVVWTNDAAAVSPGNTAANRPAGARIRRRRDSPIVWIRANFPAGISLAKSAELATEIRRLARESPEVHDRRGDARDGAGRSSD